MDKKEIKEISLLSYININGDKTSTGLLVISSQWISYVETSKTKETNNSWSYRTTNRNYLSKYNKLVEYIENGIGLVQFTGESKYSFNLRIKYKDNKCKDITCNGTFVDNGLYDLSLFILKMIPENECYPWIIQPFQTVDYDDHDLKELKFEDVIAFNYYCSNPCEAEWIKIIKKDHNCYSIDAPLGGFSHLQIPVCQEVNNLILACDKYNNNSNNIDPDWNLITGEFGACMGYRYSVCGDVCGLIYSVNHDYMIDKFDGLILNNGSKKKPDQELSNSKTIVETKVIELNGDALENDCDVLCHQVNLAGVMGGGIAFSIARKYPSVEKEYVNYDKMVLGEVCFAKTDNYVIANCFSQTQSFDTDYSALGECLDKVVSYLKENNLNSVAIPYKYGCGIANGDWNTVRGIFVDKLKGYTLKIYKL